LEEIAKIVVFSLAGTTPEGWASKHSWNQIKNRIKYLFFVRH